MKYRLFYILFNLNRMFIYAETKYPVDISYMVSDLKYSQEHGLKICEVQHGTLSTLTGDLYILGDDGNICPMIADFFALFPMKKWATTGLIYPPLQRSLVEKEWNIQHSMKTLLKDPTFLECAALPPVDPFSITSYTGIVYAAADIVGNFDSYLKTYPGILFIDAVTLPYWRDKYTMNALFDHNDELKQYKADWKLYPKKYDPLLSERIQNEMPSQLYVIKPRRECLANGVIVVANKDLDGVLQMILEPTANLGKHPDKKYSYWRKSREDTFLIERYYTSDYLRFSQPLGEKTSYEGEVHYDATMRLAFILKYDRGNMTYHPLGGFWKLPLKALEEEGTLNEKRIACCIPPFYTAIDPELLKEAHAQLEKSMLLLYEIMLNKLSQ